MDSPAECVYECGKLQVYWAWQTTNTWHPICHDCLNNWWDGSRCVEGCEDLLFGEICEAHRRQGWPNPWYRTWQDIPPGYVVHYSDDVHHFAIGVGLVPHPQAADNIRNEFLALIGLDNLEENTDA